MTETVKENNRVVVKIFGEEYPIAGVADQAYISRVADYVDSKMKETAKNSQVKSRDKVAILAAMSIASEYYEKSNMVDNLDIQSNQRVTSLVKKLDKILAK